jgi:FtsH-binding integral membrane protein
MDIIGNVASAFNGQGSAESWGSVFKTSDLSPRTQTHLVKVYATLAVTLLASAIGTAADMRFHLGGALSALGSVLLLLVLSMNKSSASWRERGGLLALYGFLQGCSLGPLVTLAMYVDPAIVLTAFLGTATIFVAFSLSAIYSQRRSYLFLGGMIGSAMMFMMVLSLVSIFTGRSMWMYSVHLYLGLAVFCAYVLYDTQMIIEKAECGSDDFVSHALELFMDFIAIFVRILIIVLQNSAKKQREQEDRKRTTRR